MGKSVLTKVMKYELCYKDGCGDFYNMQKEVWTLQRQTRDILNRTIQMTYHWDYLDQKHQDETGQHLDIKNETGANNIQGYIYNRMKGHYNLAAGNISATLRSALSKYSKTKKDILLGKMSIPSFRDNQPLILRKDTVKLFDTNRGPEVVLTLFSDQYKKEHDFSNLRFALHLHDNTQRSIFRKIMDKEYSLGECKLVYKRQKEKKSKWFLYLTYSFSPEQQALNPEKILGVDRGETCAIYASSYGEHGWLKITGGEITEFDKRMKVRKCAAQDRRVSEFAGDLEEQVYSRQNQAAHCGEGRIGHGTKTRVASVYKIKDRISNYRDTINHRYSKALVDYAVKNGYGTIQMEDLTGIKEDTGFPKFLRHWSYYDLQHKIEYKAREHGITVKYVNPLYTSQRCSRCGNIDKANRPNQATFLCTKCGFAHNADYNASQNISIPDIDKIIDQETGANHK